MLLHNYISRNLQIKFLVILVLLFIQATIRASKIEDCSYSENKPYKIPIVAWRLIAPSNYPDTTKLADIRECGFNTVIYFNERIDADSICRLVEKSQLNIIIGSSKLKTHQAQDFISSLSTTSNILGWYLQDEPYYDTLPKLKNEYDYLNIYSQGKPIYINLIGALSKKYTGPCKTMGEYLDTIESMLHPQIWSYDYYPISRSSNEIQVNYNQFFKSLKAFQEQSQKTRRPFWAFCQSMEFKNSEIERPAATIPYLRFEAFCALGFGAKGIVYWGYELPKSGKEQYISALIDSLGRKTSAWFDAQKVNREIAAYNNVFNHSNIRRVYIPNEGLLFPQNNSLFDQPVESIHSISTNGKGVLMSDFTSNDNNYLLIVNLDIEKSQDLTLTLYDSIKYTQLEYQEVGKIKLIPIDSVFFHRKISPGGYIVISYDDSSIHHKPLP